jgi:hypothetical protein
MSILGSIGAALGIGKSAAELANGVASAIDRFVQTKEEKEAAAILKAQIDQRPDEWQAAINMEEAKHRSLFVAGWRPFIGWVCGVGLCWNWILKPIATFVIAILVAKGVMFPIGELPTLGAGEIVGLVMSMLGLGALRSYEKKAGLTG